MNNKKTGHMKIKKFSAEKIRKIIIDNNNKIKQCEFAINKNRGAFEFFIRGGDDKRMGSAILYDKKIFKETNNIKIKDDKAVKRLIISSIYLYQELDKKNRLKIIAKCKKLKLD